MDEYEDPLDLLGDDGDGVIEMCLLDEEAKREKKRGGNSNSGCSIVLLALSSSALLSIWGITKII